MAYLNALQGGQPMSPQPASPGMGPAPSLPGLPPPPTGMGAMPLGAPGTDKKSAGNDAITGLRSFQGFAPNMLDDINAMIAKIKDAVTDKPGEQPGPALGEPGPPGAAQDGTSPLMDSGGPGPF